MKSGLKILAVATLLTSSLSSCYVNEHVVGNGGTNDVTLRERQWYALWGLVPFNEVDTERMAKSVNYTVQTEYGVFDGIITMATFGLIGSRTVRVTK